MERGQDQCLEAETSSERSDENAVAVEGFYVAGRIGGSVKTEIIGICEEGTTCSISLRFANTLTHLHTRLRS